MNNSAYQLRHHLVALAIAVSCVGINQASASPLLPISGVTATSSSGNAEGLPSYTVSNNSLDGGTVLGASDSLGDSGFNSYTPPSTPNYTSGTNSNGSDFGNWVTGDSGDATITYNLGGTYNVSDLLIWNFSQGGFTDVGANSVTIKTSTNGTLFSTLGTFTFTEAAATNYNSPRLVDSTIANPQGIANLGPAATTEPAQDLNFAALSIANPDAKYVELIINSNYGSPTGLVGLNEVNFVGSVVDVPEPATYAMMLAGLAVLGFCIRRKSALVK